MSLFQRALGFELAAGCWRAVHLEARLSGTRVLGCGDAEAAAEALAEAAYALDVLPGTRLGIALARPNAHLKRMTLPRASRSAVREALQDQAASIFPMGARAALADVRLVKRNGRRRDTGCEGLVAAVAKVLMERLASCASELRLRLRSTDLAAGAVRLLLPRGVDSALLLDDCGIEWVHFGKRACVAGSHYYPAAVEDGAAGGSETGRLPKAIRDGLGTGPVVVLGPDALLGTLQGQNGDAGAAFERLGPAMRGLSGLDRLELTAACGAGLQALGAPALFDLRPEAARVADRAVRRRRRIGLVALLLFAVAVNALGGFIRLRSEVVRLEHAVAELRPRAEEVLELRGAIAEAAARADVLAGLEAQQPRWTSVIAELTRALPADAYLTALREEGGRIRLEGYATATPRVVGALQRSEMFASVRLAGPVTRERTPRGERERFTVELALAGGEEEP